MITFESKTARLEFRFQRKVSRFVGSLEANYQQALFAVSSAQNSILQCKYSSTHSNSILPVSLYQPAQAWIFRDSHQAVSAYFFDLSLRLFFS